MAEFEAQESSSSAGASSASGRVVPFPRVAASQDVTFGKDELRTILNLYGRMVASGEWRDYAIEFGRDRAVFSVYRRTSEMPLYRIVKDPKAARRQGAYSVTNTAGMVLKRGHELDRVLRVLEPKLTLVTN